MKNCQIILLVIAIMTLVLAGEDHDLVEYSNPNFEPISIANREIRASVAKPLMTKLTPTTLNVTLPIEGYYTVAIMSVNGRRLYTRTYALAAGDRSIVLDNFNSPTGMVLVEVFGAGIRSVQKMTIQR